MCQQLEKPKELKWIKTFQMIDIWGYKSLHRFLKNALIQISYGRCEGTGVCWFESTLQLVFKSRPLDGFQWSARENSQQVSKKALKRHLLSGTAHPYESGFSPHTPIQTTYNNKFMTEAGKRTMPSFMTTMDMPPSMYLFLNVIFSLILSLLTYNEFLIIAFKGIVTW